MKKIILFIALFVSGILIGCTKVGAMNEMCFKTLHKENYGRVVYDTRTGVQYWMSSGVHNAGSLTLLVDENGNPLLYNE